MATANQQLFPQGVVGSGGSGSSLIRSITQTGHGFVTGNAVYFNGTIWAKAKANADSTLGLGVVVVTDANNFDLYIAGKISSLSGLTVGQYYFVSDVTAGALTATEPTATNSFSNPLLFATSATEGLVLPFRPAKIVSGSTTTGTSLSIHQVAHGFSTGQGVYFTGSAWALAKANVSSTLGLGVITVTDADNFIAYFGGPISGLSGLAAGQYYFLSDVTSGLLTTAEPTTVGSFSEPLLFSTATNAGVVMPYRPSLVVGAATAGKVLRGNGTVFVSATLAAADLSNGTTGTGAVALAGSPVFTTQITTPVVAGGPGATDIVTINGSSNASPGAGADVHLSDGVCAGRSVIIGGGDLKGMGNVLVGTNATANAGTWGFSNGNGPGLVFWGNTSGGTGDMFFTTNGSLVMRLFKSGGLNVGAPTGGDKGAGTINVTTGLYLNGTAYTPPSDFRLKTDILPFNSGLDAVLALEPVRYKWNTEGQQISGYNGQREMVGLVAQEVENVIPQAAVPYGEWKSFDDRAIIAALINAVKELTARVKELEHTQGN